MGVPARSQCLSRPPLYCVDSERSDECIDFTMMYVFFFVSGYSVTSRNNASISNFGGGFRWKSEYPWCIIEKNKKKNDGKTGIFTQNQFSTESIFLYGCNSKTNYCKYLNFSPNVNVSVIYTVKFSKNTEIFDFYANFFFEVSFKFLRNLSKTRKCAMRLNFKFLRNRVTITIYPQTILNICYYSKSISSRYLKILP
ncbi:hypothetical protein AGLY_010611, partial [Aphis glycines]